MNSPKLTVQYTPDDDYVGELTVKVDSRDFAGQSKAWFDRTWLKENFIAALRAFPILIEDPPLIEGGFGSKTVPGTLEQCHVRIAVRPYNSQGLLIVQTDLTTESWKSPDQDYQQCITARFLTEYALLDIFAQELEEVLSGRRESATLSGSPR